MTVPSGDEGQALRSGTPTVPDSQNSSHRLSGVTLAAQLLEGKPANAPAVRLGELTLGYGALREAHAAAMAELAAAGLRPGERVLLILPNGVEHLVGLLAVTSLGAIAVPLAPDSVDTRLTQVLRDTRPRLCLALDGLALPGGLAVRRLAWDPAAARIRFSPAGDRGRTPTPPVASAGTDAVIRFSSGSTGAPKGVLLNHAQLVWTAQTLSGVFGLDTDHRELLVASMALSGGWQRVAATLAGGGCVILSDGPLSLPALFEDLQAYEVSGFFSPPPLIRMLLQSPEQKARAALRHCRSIEIGSAVIGADELARLMALAPQARIFCHYGMTECSRAVILDGRAHPDKLDTVGRPAPGVEVAVRDAQGRTCGPGATGQIHVRGPQLASGYWGRPALTGERYADGWLATGDLGRLDEEGFLSFVGRVDDMINAGGHSFSPTEVEQALGPVAGVSEYLVAGVPDPAGLMGQVPWVFVVPTDPGGWSPQDLMAQARRRLPAHMVPRWVVSVPALPLTASGKPDRRRTVENFGPGGPGVPRTP